MCQAFKDQVRLGEIRSVTKAKEEAAKLWKTNSSFYDASRATHAPGTDNNPRGVKRIRLSGETINTGREGWQPLDLRGLK